MKDAKGKTFTALEERHANAIMAHWRTKGWRPSEIVMEITAMSRRAILELGRSLARQERDAQKETTR